MQTRGVYFGVVILLVIAVTTGAVLFRTLRRDALFLAPYAIVPASSTVTVPGARSTLVLDRLFSTSTEGGTFAKTVVAGQVGVSASYIDLRVIGEPVKLSEIIVSMRPVMARELHSGSVRQIVVRREGLEGDYSVASERECNSTECRFRVDISNLFKNTPVLYSAPARLKVDVDLEAAGVANLGDAFQFVIAGAEDIKAQGLLGEPVSVMNLGSTLSAIHVVPFSIRVSASWPIEPTITPPATEVQIGTFEVVNESELPIYLDSAVFDVKADIRTKIYYSLKASEDGSNPNDISFSYAKGKRSGFFGELSSVPLSDRMIKPKSWRYLTIFAQGDIRQGDSFEVRVKDIGNVRYGVLESDLGYSGNAAEDKDTNDEIGSLLAGGMPRLGRVTIR